MQEYRYIYLKGGLLTHATLRNAYYSDGFMVNSDVVMCCSIVCSCVALAI